MVPPVLIGSPLGDRVEITVLGRMHPGATDFDDGTSAASRAWSRWRSGSA
ncbi:hypothetical protein SAMN05421835_101347 [Amycolatopsis sacchari]|uniref:Uncharacterized protein n=1 Tax=Amycolatopsis sacchari TaxID=115433 RepID=A0A1I3JZF1_9PSEU|nr:hypothetical protein SAMN05421835_101347 [Amycolatopsis sacchari]